MLKYTGSYANTEKSFVFLNIDNNIKIKDDTLYGIFCVVQNIIQRGMVSAPSKFLEKKLGKLVGVGEPCFLLPKNDARWNLIKGDIENVDYPAEEFYDKILDKYLGEYRFVKNLIVPEADFKDVLGYSSVMDGQQVDFYIPQIKTVIEIDGASHLRQGQIFKDQVRDKALQKENIEIIRITMGEVRNETKSMQQKMNNLYSKLKDSALIKKYNTNEMDPKRIRYDAVYRIQMLFLALMKSGKVKLDKPINVQVNASDVEDINNLIQVAYDDLSLWIKNIAQLLKYDILLPEIYFEETNGNCIRLDFSIRDRYTDMTVVDDMTIYVRNAYYVEQNYYEIATADTLNYRFDVEQEEKDDEALRFILKNIFSFDDFNDGQISIIKNVLEKKDTIGILPTGGGKSLTYQLCAMLQPGITLVVVPIISLMQDQKRGMDSRGMDRTAYLSSEQTGVQKNEIINELTEGRFQLVWSSPERFQNQEFRDSLREINRKKNFALTVIDEVHCMSEWGHDFRVSYLELIPTVRKYCPEATLLGLTATASQAVLEDLKVEFEDDGSGVKALTSMDRPELKFIRKTIHSNKEREDVLVEIVERENEDYINADGTKKHKLGLIFCPTVSYSQKHAKCNSADEVSKILDKRKYSGKKANYNGQMAMEDRSRVQEEFMNNKYDVMVCTKAFGMGIDKDNIKYTIHTALPQSVESFYQEAGRAGREKDKSVQSECYILFQPEDINAEQNVEKLFNANTSIEERKVISESLQKDLNTIMFFWNNNRKTVDQEYANISSVLRRLYLGNTSLRFSEKIKENNLQNTQAALYKLYLLGIIDNWTVQYDSLSEGTINVEYNGLDEKRVFEQLNAYIHKYDTEFTVNSDSKRYHKYFEITQTKEKRLTQYIKILIEWANDNILYNRLQSTYTMLQWMKTDVSDAQFRRNIVEYFKFSEKSVIFEGIIHNPLEYENWFDLLYRTDSITNQRIEPIDKEDADRLLASLQRYLESYRNNTGFNYLSGLLRLLSGKYLNSEGEWRFEEALQNIKDRMDAKNQAVIIMKTLECGKLMTIENKDVLSMKIIERFEGYEEKIFDELEDRYSLSIILEGESERLEKIVKEKI